MLGTAEDVKTNSEAIKSSAFYTWSRQCWPEGKNLHRFRADTGCSLEDLPGTMDDRDG